jgi:hypothetical protein
MACRASCSAPSIEALLQRAQVPSPLLVLQLQLLVRSQGSRSHAEYRTQYQLLHLLSRKPSSLSAAADAHIAALSPFSVSMYSSSNLACRLCFRSFRLQAYVGSTHCMLATGCSICAGHSFSRRCRCNRKSECNHSEICSGFHQIDRNV